MHAYWALHSFWNLRIRLYITTLLSCSTLVFMRDILFITTIAKKKTPKLSFTKLCHRKKCNVISLWNCELPWANGSRAIQQTLTITVSFGACLPIPPSPCGFVVGLAPGCCGVQFRTVDLEMGISLQVWHLHHCALWLSHPITTGKMMLILNTDKGHKKKTTPAPQLKRQRTSKLWRR